MFVDVESGALVHLVGYPPDCHPDISVPFHGYQRGFLYFIYSQYLFLNLIKMNRCKFWFEAILKKTKTKNKNLKAHLSNTIIY
jgi:hypothetical protein